MAYQTFTDWGPRMAWDGSRLRKIRRMKNLTQKEAAELMAPISDAWGLKEKVSAKMLSDYELGKEQPKADNLAVICKALGIEPKFLLALSKYWPLIELRDSEWTMIIKKHGGDLNALDDFMDQTMLNGGSSD